jgi:predicted MFS family arabinose efflux permease
MNATMRSFNRAAVVVGAPLGGLFVDAVGLRPALWLGAAGIGAAGVLLAASGFRTASHDDEAP